jgi:type I restriction-modification system DNA methylase subunit
MAKKKASETKTTANIGFEAKLWLAADKLRNNMDAAEYKHVVLGLIFLKYISDTFEEHRAKLLAGEGDYAGANPEDPDEYKAENVFWVPTDARWSHLQANAKQPTIGKVVDESTTRRLAIMNLSIRGIEADIGKEHADTFRNVQHPDLRADYVLANPPFNDSDWFRKDDDVRWQFQGECELRLGAAFHPPPCTARHGGVCTSQREHVFQPIRRRGDSPRDD